MTTTILQNVRKMGIKTDSFVVASRIVTDQHLCSTKDEYDEKIKGLVSIPVVTKHKKEAELIFEYLIQEAIRAESFLSHPTNDELVELAKQKSKEYLIKNPWLDPEVIAKKALAKAAVTEQVKRASRNGELSKKDRSRTLFEKNRTKSRKDLLDLFMKELDLSWPGASTYVHNWQHGVWK